MVKANEQGSTARGKAEKLLMKRSQQEVERISTREKESRAQDEKAARLRVLRLAKEAADREAAPKSASSSTKKAAKSA